MPRRESAFPGLALALALLSLALPGCRKTGDKAGPKGAPVAETAGSGAAGAEAPQTAGQGPKIMRSPEAFQSYAKYTGTLGDTIPLTVDMTVMALWQELNVRGKFHFGDGIKSWEHFGGIYEPGVFEFGHRGEAGDSIVFTGTHSGFDAFEGTCISYRIDSTYDSLAYTWKKSGVRETRPFRIARTVEGTVPVVFESFLRENDSGSEARKREGKIEYHYDTLPSSLRLTLAQVKSNDGRVDSAINRSILHSLLAFYDSASNADFANAAPSVKPILDDFDRVLANSKGAFFSTDYSCDVETNEHGVLSIRYTMHSYAGGAHGTYEKIWVNYDAATGAEIHLSDILTENFHIELGRLAGIPSCDGDPENEYPCTIESLLKGGFSIAHGGLDFNRNDFGRGMAVHIPYSDLKPIVDKHGILARFLP